MRFFLTLFAAYSLPCAALTCGLYQVEDFGDRVTYSITRAYSTGTDWNQTLYTITNPGTILVRSMVRGSCYCVEGPVQLDPEFDNDVNFQLLTIETVKSHPFSQCLPPK